MGDLLDVCPWKFFHLIAVVCLPCSVFLSCVPTLEEEVT